MLFDALFKGVHKTVKINYGISVKINTNQHKSYYFTLLMSIVSRVSCTTVVRPPVRPPCVQPAVGPGRARGDWRHQGHPRGGHHQEGRARAEGGEAGG